MSSPSQVERLARDVAGLHATRGRRRSSLARFEKYRDDPVGFIERLLGGKLWPGLVGIAEGVRDHRFTVVRSCNGAGKDWTAARLIAWWVLARRGFVLVTGPTDRQVREVVMGELRRALFKVPELPGELLETSWRFDARELMGALAFTSNDVSRITGHHAPRLLVVITEAQGVEPYAWEGILANATGQETRVLAVGNPLASSGRFFEACRSPAWHSIRLSAFEHPNVLEGREVIPGAVTQGFVELIAGEYGETSGTYRARVCGEFPDENEQGLIRRSWLDAAAERWTAKTLEEQATGQEVVAALDPARYGPDTSVLALRQGPILRELVAWSKLDTMETTGRVIETLRSRGIEAPERVEVPDELRGWTRVPFQWSNASEVIVDEVGLGAGVADRLREQGYRVAGFNGGRAPRDPRRFLNARAESYWHLRKLLEEGRIALLRDERLFDELAALKWTTTSEGKVKLESKDDLRARLGRSPDRADAVAMLFSTFRRGGVPTFERPVRWVC
jgi:phage terminase large subunit